MEGNPREKGDSLNCAIFLYGKPKQSIIVLLTLSSDEADSLLFAATQVGK